MTNEELKKENNAERNKARRHKKRMFMRERVFPVMLPIAVVVLNIVLVFRLCGII